jgi:class 3 adenylate cyclase
LYLSPQIVQSIFEGKQDVALTTSRKKLTVFFSDLVNFTQTTENLEPELLSSILNDYLDKMVTIALKYGATIDKFIGDGIMLFFGDPDSLGEQEDAINCISMAIEMRERVEQFGTQWFNKGLHEPLQVRMGVATGFVTVGNFGSTHRMDYTIIGSHVNIASRLEQTANPNGILISHETYSLVKDAIYCEKQDTIFLKGILYPVTTYKVIDFFENIQKLKEINIVNEQLSLYLNKESIKPEDKERIIATLQKVIDEVQLIQ